MARTLFLGVPEWFEERILYMYAQPQILSMSIELLKQCSESPVPEELLRNAAKQLGGLLGDHDDPLNLK